MSGELKFSSLLPGGALTGTEGYVTVQAGADVLITPALQTTYTQAQKWAADLLPDAANTRSLGSSAAPFKQLYLGPSPGVPVLNDGVIGYWPQTPAEIAAGVTPTNYAYPPGNVLRYGADANGINDSATAFNSARASNSSFIIVPSGTYKLNSNPSVGLWQVSAGVTFTGTGSISGQIIEQHGSASNYTFRIVTNAQTVGQLIPIDFECGFYQTATPNAADQFGQTTECWTPLTSAVVWNGQLTGTYGSFSHFGSGNIYGIFGGAFEGFNSGPATSTLVVGVSGTANNGGVAAGDPQQNPTNNGAATNLRALDGVCNNSSSGVVASAAAIYAEAATNTGGGSITNNYGIAVADQTAGATNYAIYTGAGINYFGDVVKIAGSSNLPASAGLQQLIMAGGGGAAVVGRIYCGDGTGYQLEFAKRTASADTVIGYITDAGNIIASGGIAVNGATSPPAKLTGWGTPTGGSVVNNFPGSTATLAQCGEAISEIIATLKAMGIFGA